MLHVQHQLLPNALGDLSALVGQVFGRHPSPATLGDASDALRVQVFGRRAQRQFSSVALVDAGTGSTAYEPVCDVAGSVLVNAKGDPVMAILVL